MKTTLSFHSACVLQNMKIYVFTLLMIFSCSTLKAQVTFQRIIGNINTDLGASLVELDNGGYIINAACADPTFIVARSSLIKTDLHGAAEWMKSYWTLQDGTGHVLKTSDGGTIFVGMHDDLTVYGTNWVLIKTNSFGDTIGSKSYLGTMTNSPVHFSSTSDGGYIIVGSSDSIGISGNRWRTRVMKTDIHLDMEWTHDFLSPMPNSGSDIMELPGGDYLIIGHLFVPEQGDWDIFLAKIDSSGNLLWSKTYGGPLSDNGISLRLTDDGGFIILGYSSISSIGSTDICLIKTDSSGNIQWSKEYGGASYEYPVDVYQTDDGGYIIGGTTGSFGQGDQDFYLIKTDPAGVPLWSKTYGGNGWDGCSSMIPTSDGGYALVGATMGFGASGIDIYLVKTDADGNSGCNETTPVTLFTSVSFTVANNDFTRTSWGGYGTVFPFLGVNQIILNVNPLCQNVSVKEDEKTVQEVSLFPNPFSTSAIIKINSDLYSENLTLNLFSLLGNQVRQMPVHSHEIRLTREGLGNGLYFYTLVNDQNIIAKGTVIIN